MAFTSAAAGAVRRADGFGRYAVSLQYHGASFLGFSFQKNQEDCVLPDGTDLRGYRSVEGRLRHALEDLFGKEHEQWENIQVSSRTDRGVHAWKNTFHLDVNEETFVEQGLLHHQGIIKRLYRGLNFHLSRQQSNWERDSAIPSQLHRKRKRKQQQPSFTYLGKDSFTRYSVNNEVRILSAAKAPEYMENDYALQQDPSQPAQIDWNARFSATQRTYVYRILCYNDYHDKDEENGFGIPFEWDRAWRIRGRSFDRATVNGLDIEAMKIAADHMDGAHDFSTFRGARCQRQSPVVTMKSIQIHSVPYLECHPFGKDIGHSIQKFDNHGFGPQLVTICIIGDSFLYRQVRNMVGCLVEVGRGKLDPSKIPGLLQARQRSQAPSMAPAHGLFLADVQHGDFRI
jgi:tRNA pseudouridine38-40 synthase